MEPAEVGRREVGEGKCKGKGEEREGKGKQGGDRQAGREGGRTSEGRRCRQRLRFGSVCWGGGVVRASSFITSEQFARKRRTKLQGKCGMVRWIWGGLKWLLFPRQAHFLLGYETCDVREHEMVSKSKSRL